MDFKASGLDHNLVEMVAAAIVREYLHGKGCQKTMQCIDSEMIRTDDSISSRSMLAKVLHIEKLLKKNKQNENALKTMLEVLVKYFLCHSKSKKASAPMNIARYESILHNRIQDNCTEIISSSKPQCDGDHITSWCAASVKQPLQNNAIDVALNLQSPRAVDNPPLTTNDQDKAQQQDAGLNLPTLDFSDEFKNAMKHAQKATFADHSRKKKKQLCKNPLDSLTDDKPLSGETMNASQTVTKMCEENINRLSGNEELRFAMDLKQGKCDQHELSTAAATKVSHGTNQDDEMNNAETKKRSTKPSVSQCRLFSGPITRGGLQSGRGSLTSAARRNFLSSAANHPVKLNLISHHDEETSNQSMDYKAFLGENEVKSRRKKSDCEEVNSNDSYKEAVDGTVMGNRVTSEQAVHSPSNKINLKIALVGLCGDLEVGDLDELDESNSGVLVSPERSYAWLTMPYGTPIQYETAIELKTLLLGSCKKDFPLEWKMQSFSLSTYPKLNYGIVQKKGGPCGVLACVQAYLIKELMFVKSWNGPIKGRTTEEICKKSLINALAQILWKIGRSQKAVIVMPTDRTVVDLSGLRDGFIERINLMQFTDFAALQSFLTRHATWFTDDNKYSCISFLYSAILSRGIATVKNDMDDPKSYLIGTHGYCSQEVVNLLLTGCASTNVFDNVITLDDGKESQSILKGVTCQSEIGLLALFEHYNSCQVGAFLKCPRYPIWVICSESHFSVLFAKDSAACESLLENENRINKFDLYYYDGLLHQEDEIRLTLSLSNTSSIIHPNDLVPPLDLCIRTKWKDAHIEWNGIEPLL